MVKVLGIETSCDETAVAIVDENKQTLFHELWVQDHTNYGGVFPEHAARNHLIKLQTIVKRAFECVPSKEISAIASTAGPGLIGGLIVGTTFAKSLAYALDKPFIAVNHLEGHALMSRFTNDVPFPFLLMLISGGHSEILIAHDVGKYTKLGCTVDDSIGETFDKVAKMMKLPYPGGPIIEKMAQSGNENRFNFPMPLCTGGNLNFSFSGLKTFVHNTIKKNFYPGNDVASLKNKSSIQISETDICDISASLQKCISNILLYKLKHSFETIKSSYPQCKSFVISGGVASNKYIRDKLENLSKSCDINFIAPPIELCTDNGIMIAWAGMERFIRGMVNELSFEPRARWALDDAM